MKKTISLLLSLLLCICALASCSTYMTEYTDERIGLYYELPSYLEYVEYSSTAEVYKTYRETDDDGNVIALIEIYFVSNADLEKNDAFGADITLEEYLTYNITEVNGIDGEKVDINYSTDKNRASYDFLAKETEDTAGVYTHYTFVKNSKGICRVEMSCNETLMTSYGQQFVLWAKSIRVV